MEFKKTGFKDLTICQPTIIEDARGYFFEAYKQQDLDRFLGFTTIFVQDNQSQSSYGVLRGLHFQRGVHAQAKLVRVLEGAVLDVVVDLRKEEPTYGSGFSIELSAANNTQLYIPKGMAHGFVTLSKRATFFYKCDRLYHQESERGLAYNDPSLKIDWQISQKEVILSDKDARNPPLLELEKNIDF